MKIHWICETKQSNNTIRSGQRNFVCKIILVVEFEQQFSE